MSMTTTFDVAIVGYGPVGQTLAITGRRAALGPLMYHPDILEAEHPLRAANANIDADH